MVLPFEAMTMTFKDLHYWVQIPKVCPCSFAPLPPPPSLLPAPWVPTNQSLNCLYCYNHPALHVTLEGASTFLRQAQKPVMCCGTLAWCASVGTCLYAVTQAPMLSVSVSDAAPQICHKCACYASSKPVPQRHQAHQRLTHIKAVLVISVYAFFAMP